MNNTPTPTHRFSVLPYMSPGDPRGSIRILVVVCDCGWIAMTDNEELGMGWDAAVLYRDHVAEAAAGYTITRTGPEPEHCPTCNSSGRRIHRCVPSCRPDDHRLCPDSWHTGGDQ